MKLKLLTICFLLSSLLLIAGCGFSKDDTTEQSKEMSIYNSDLPSFDPSRIVNSFPGHDDKLYTSPEDLLGVTEEPKKIVAKLDESKSSTEYEKLASGYYTMYLFEHEDGTASQVYYYYFFDNKEDFQKAYDAFCMSQGSPSVKNEKSLFFGHGGAAELYLMGGRPTFSDISVSLNVKNAEIITSWSEESPSESQDSSQID